MKNFNPVSGLFFKSNSPKPLPSKDTSNNKIDLMMATLAVSHAEILWVLKVLTSHHSFRSCLNLNQLFCIMFPDSDIAKPFQFSKAKCVYYIVHGLAPYFIEILLQEIKKLPTYSTLFWQKCELSTAGRTNECSDSFLEWKSFWSPNTLPKLKVA